jgi:hypothetical protein
MVSLKSAGERGCDDLRFFGFVDGVNVGGFRHRYAPKDPAAFTPKVTLSFEKLLRPG